MPQMTLQQVMQQAIAHHQAGRLREAEAIYRQVLVQQPNQPDALNLLGAVAFQVGQFPVAIDLIGRAIAVNPAFAEYHYNLAQAFSASGRTQEAIASYHRTLELRPDHAQAWNNLGIALHAVGQTQAGIAALRKAVELRPDYAQAFYNLGNLLHAGGDLEQAISAYRQSVTIHPNVPEAWNNLGNSLRDFGNNEEAVVAYRRACELNPNHSEAHSNLGCMLQESGQVEQGLSMIRKAILLQPDSVAAHHNLGNALLAAEQLDEAIATFRRVTQLKPDFSDGHNGLGYALREKGEVRDSIVSYERALAAYPKNPRAHHNLGIALLLEGEYEKGWPHYEWRFAANEPNALAMRLKEPKWDGSDLAGRTILIHAEQAFGDTIQFARYLPMVAGRGGKVIFQCHPELERVMRSASPAVQVIPRDGDLPPFDLHCPLLSLPMLMKTTLSTIPAKVPYLHAEPELSSRWRDRMPKEGLKVGIVWAGRITSREYRKRAIDPKQLAPLTEAKGVNFISLQKGAEHAGESAQLGLIDWTTELNDFADTAALIDNLDLVISVDTATGHLAGAMGKPTLMFIQSIPDWRWLRDRDDSPWYPTLRLFRQTEPGNWSAAIDRVAAALRDSRVSKGAGADAP